MGFSEIRGQDTALHTLTRALESGRVHHAYRFEGPPGVGKERTALRFARALVCEVSPLGCEACSACRRAITLSQEEPHVPLHPDVVLVGRGIYKSVTGQAEQQGIGVAQVRRVVLERVGFRPHEGRALVFVVRDADEITVQAANSLLKILEEPPRDTYFVLVTSRPSRLLDTIRSRTLPVRFGPLPDAVIADILRVHEIATDEVSLAQGSAERALLLSSEDKVRERREFAQALDQALAARDMATGVRFAESQKGERDALKHQLAFFAQSLSLGARAALEAAPQEAERAARRHARVLRAMDDLDQNVQPALALEAMIVGMREG